MAPLIHPAHVGLRNLGYHDDMPDVDLDPIARFMLVWAIAFLLITAFAVLLKLLGVCLLACLIGCRNGTEERVVYRVSRPAGASYCDGRKLTAQIYQPLPHDQQPLPHPLPQARARGVARQQGGDEEAPPPPYTPHDGPKNYGATS